MEVNCSSHYNHLQNLCRVCGCQIILKTGYKNPKKVVEYTTTISKFYNINVDNEDPQIYPKNLCSNCRRKLDRLSQNSTASGNLEIHTYDKHDDDSCVICKKETTSEKNVAVTVMDRLFINAGYVKIHHEEYKRVYCHQLFKDEKILQKIVIFITYAGQWKCHVYGQEISKENCFLQKLAENITKETLESFVDFFSTIDICDGIKDYDDIIARRLDMAFHIENATIENIYHYPVKAEECIYVRHNDCVVFCYIDKICDVCSNFKSNLKRIKSSIDQPANKRQRTDHFSRVNYRYLSNEELKQRLSNVNKEKQYLARSLSAVKQNIKDTGISVDWEQHRLFQKMLCENSQPFKEDSPQGLLWQQQKDQAQLKNSRGMRWHPLIIRWCLSLYYTSAAAYKQMTSKKLNFLQLPHINTLRRYTHFTTPSSGFNPDVLQKLIEDSGLAQLSPFQKYVVLAYDEMQIKSDLVFRKSTGQMIGFTDIGDIHEEFRLFQSNIDNSSTSSMREFATHVIVYLVRGVFTDLEYPFGYFASTGMTSAQLYLCTIEAIRVLSSISFKVCALVSDGATPNRQFYKLLLLAEDDLYHSPNPFDDNILYHFSDQPHLLKTTRKCLENSGFNKNSRNLHLDGQDISWKHVIDVYNWDLGCNKAAPGLRKLHRLRDEHIYLKPRMRMNVKLAAQVFSQSTANALESQGLHNTKSTTTFIRMIDRVFDCLNVSKINKGKFSKKELAPYTDVNDWRFEFLEKDFLQGYLQRWEDQAMANTGMKLEEKNKLLLSKQTRLGWKMTVKSFVELGKKLLQLDGVQFLLSEKFSQDPVEEHFARQRRRGGCNENPTYYQFQNQELTLNVMRSDMIKDLKGNTRGKVHDEEKLDANDKRKLPTKKQL